MGRFRLIGAKISERRYTWSVVWVVAPDADDACGRQLPSIGKGADYFCWATVAFVLVTVNCRGASKGVI